MQRDRLSLDGTWDFHFCGDLVTALDAVPSWRSCTVPNPWQAEFPDLRERNGRAWYRRTVEVDADWLFEAAVLRFGAVNYFSRVFVNGHLAVEHEGGYLPFEADVAGLLRVGTNEIAVEVAAPTGDAAAWSDHPFAEIPFGKQSWYGPLGGIWQSVALERRSADHIAALRLLPDAATGTVRAEIRLSRPLPWIHDIDLTLEDARGEDARDQPVAATSVTLGTGLSEVVTFLTVPAPALWSPESPALYRLTATLRSRGGARDAVTESFGFRTVETRDGRIHLNGKPLFLRAALDQDYYPDGICTAPSEAFIEDQFRKAKELGLNCLRCHIKVPDPRYYAVADRLGLLIWTELPNSGRLTEKSAARAEATLRGIVERDGNHPSIICWTIINENWGTDLVHDAGHRAWLKRMFTWLKHRDPTRLVVDNSALGPSWHVKSDLEDIHFYAAIPDHRRAWDGFVEGLAARPAWTWSDKGDAERTGAEPLLCSEFGNWGLPDPEALKGADGKEPWWFETGHDWGDGVMYPHGVENRFRAAGLERVFGSIGRFAEAAQMQQYHALKYQIEAMRRQPALAGYVITEFTDCHWESNGLLDMRRNPRVFHNAFAAINGETVVAPRWRRTAYWAGETVEVGLSAAHGGGDPLPPAELRWSLDTATLDADDTGGAEPLPALAHGVHPGRPACFTAPDVAQPQIHRLDIELATRERVLATNFLDIVVHPRRMAPPAGRLAVWAAEEDLRERLKALGYGTAARIAEADVAVAHGLSPDLCAAVRAGTRLVLLADRPFELQPVFPHWQAARIVPRAGSMWQGDWASSFSWLRREGPFARLPGGPLVDASFDRVIPNHVIAGINGWDFQGRVHAGLVVGWVHKPVALIVEREYGLGRMVCTTFRLTEDAPGADPTATVLLDALVELAVNGVSQEQPAESLPAEPAE